jgi:hypothetical protein
LGGPTRISRWREEVKGQRIILRAAQSALVWERGIGDNACRKLFVRRSIAGAADVDMGQGAYRPVSRLSWLMTAAAALAIAASSLGAPDSPSLAFLTQALEHLVR